MMENKNKIVEGLTSGVEFLFKKNKVTYIKGHATVTDLETVKLFLTKDFSYRRR